MAKTRPCQICMCPIEAERIEGIPETRLCLAHAKAMRKYGGEFLLSTSLVRTSKDGSIKKNYGGVNAKLRRNTEGLERLREEYREEQERQGR